MDTFMSEAIVLEAAMVSVLLALWITSIALHGLFRMMSATIRPTVSHVANPIRVAASQLQGNRRRKAA
jgi:hypothetical protein